MGVVIEVSQGESRALSEALEAAGITFDFQERRNFDGLLPVASFVVESVAGVGSIVVPIVLHFMAQSKKTKVKIRGITITGLTPEQIRQLVDDGKE